MIRAVGWLFSWPRFATPLRVPAPLQPASRKASWLVAFAKRFQARHGLVVLLAANSATLLGAWLLHWSLLNVMIVVWCETALVAVDALVRIALTGKAGVGEGIFLLLPLMAMSAATLVAILAVARKPLRLASMAGQVVRSLAQSWPGLSFVAGAHLFRFTVAVAHHEHRRLSPYLFARTAGVHLVALLFVVATVSVLFGAAPPAVALSALWVGKGLADVAAFFYHRHQVKGRA
ncbi:MAG: DUF6498-containing protein [Thermoplasmatota archaeon]